MQEIKIGSKTIVVAIMRGETVSENMRERFQERLHQYLNLAGAEISSNRVMAISGDVDLMTIEPLSKSDVFEYDAVGANVVAADLDRLTSLAIRSTGPMSDAERRAVFMELQGAALALHRGPMPDPTPPPPNETHKKV